MTDPRRRSCTVWISSYTHIQRQGTYTVCFSEHHLPSLQRPTPTSSRRAPTLTRYPTCSPARPTTTKYTSLLLADTQTCFRCNARRVYVPRRASRPIRRFRSEVRRLRRPPTSRRRHGFRRGEHGARNGLYILQTLRLRSLRRAWYGENMFELCGRA